MKSSQTFFSSIYRIAGFLCEDFYLAIRSIHSIKICKVFNALHFVSYVHFAIIMTKLNTRGFTTANVYTSMEQAT